MQAALSVGAVCVCSSPPKGSDEAHRLRLARQVEDDRRQLLLKEYDVKILVGIFKGVELLLGWCLGEGGIHSD